MTNLLQVDEPLQDKEGSLFVLFLRKLVFFGFHLTPLLVIFSGISWHAILFAVVFYVIRMFGITAGYHRYFAHRTFRTSGSFRFILALLGTLALQKDVLWWAGNHRDHHAHTDTEKDLHSPRHGFFWSHMGWFLGYKYWETPKQRIRDFSSFWYLRWLNTYWVVPFILCCIVVFFGIGVLVDFQTAFQYLVCGCFIGTVLCWHMTWCINSLAHVSMWVFSWKSFANDDDSQNNPVLAFFTLGEGWHNNHHRYPKSARQGFFWWEFDPTWWVLWTLEKLGIIWDVKRPSSSVLAERLT